MKSVKICRVCGDRAFGFNFNGLCCESCKSFFRRNALNEKKYCCIKNGNCPINCSTRKLCTKCRLDKCFAIGMTKDLLNCKLDTNQKLSSTFRLKNAPKTHPTIENVFDFKIRRDISLYITLYGVQQTKSKVLINSKRKKPFSRKIVNLIDLNLYEIGRIKEITDASSWACFYRDNNVEVCGEVTTLVEALNCSELYIKMLIKLCKNIFAFRCLKVDDQIAILKSTFTEILVICFSYSYQLEKDGFPVIGDNNLKTTVLIQMKLLREAYPQNIVNFFRDNVQRFHDEIENDPTIRDLLFAHRIFQPRETLSCSEFIKYQYTSVRHLLRRYLEDKYRNANKARVKLDKLSEMLIEMNPIKDLLEGLFIKCDSNQLSPFLYELFN